MVLLPLLGITQGSFYPSLYKVSRLNLRLPRTGSLNEVTAILWDKKKGPLLPHTKPSDWGTLTKGKKEKKFTFRNSVNRKKSPSQVSSFVFGTKLSLLYYVTYLICPQPFDFSFVIVSLSLTSFIPDLLFPSLPSIRVSYNDPST